MGKQAAQGGKDSLWRSVCGDVTATPPFRSPRSSCLHWVFVTLVNLTAHPARRKIRPQSNTAKSGEASENLALSRNCEVSLVVG